jgi:hypothetical protein
MMQGNTNVWANYQFVSALHSVSIFGSMVNLMISMQGQPISIQRPGWQFHFFVEPKEVIQKLSEGLKEGLQYIILHGNIGCGKTAVVEYVLFQHAKDLLDQFPGGIFQMEYGSDCNNILAAQKRLLRGLIPEDRKVLYHFLLLN